MADILIYLSRVIFKSTHFQIPLTRKEIAEMIESIEGKCRQGDGEVHR
ncbi:MAG: hypothetical protein U0X39_09280 [Bacteroidales bacterium]